MKINCILDTCNGQVQSRNEGLGLLASTWPRTEQAAQVRAGGRPGKIRPMGNTELGCAQRSPTSQHTQALPSAAW